MDKTATMMQGEMEDTEPGVGHQIIGDTRQFVAGMGFMEAVEGLSEAETALTVAEFVAGEGPGSVLVLW